MRPGEIRAGKMMTKLCDMTEEMKLQILTRLPPRSVMRFKCVCKSLCNLIHNPKFAAKNLSNSLNNKFASSTKILFKRTVLKDNTITDKSEIFHILRDGNNEKKEIFLSLLNLCVHNSEGQNYLSVVEDLIVPSPLGIDPFTLQIVGHCDGIICLTSADQHVALCNPAIKEFNFLPPSCLILPPKHPDDFDNEDDYYDALESGPTAVGFGYDFEANIYKVVRIVKFFSGYVFTSHPTRAEVYTLTAHSWREISFCTNTSVFWAPSFQIYFNGYFYWNALTYHPSRGHDQVIILSFDMSAEIFQEISFPENITREFLTTLAVWKESIVLIAYRDENPKTLDLWTMDDSDGSNNLWTKQLSIGPVEGEIPLVFWKSDEILMVTDNGRVISYNYGTQMLRHLPIYGIEDHQHIQAVVYVNSIISVKGPNNFEGTNS